MVSLTLKKNLRRDILRGHPWIYKEALSGTPKTNEVSLCKIVDGKNEFVAYGYYDPYNPIAVRILSTDKKVKVNQEFIYSKLQKALQIRKMTINSSTTGYRLVNGEGDQLPGLICDIYESTAVLQYDGKGPSEFWQNFDLVNWLVSQTKCQVVLNKTRQTEPRILHGNMDSEEVKFIENDVKFVANIFKGQKTGFFIDQRDNRQYVKQISNGKKVLNLFSYSGGFSMYAGAGKAESVASVDIAQGALDYADKTWNLNDFPGKHETICADVFEYLNSIGREYDLIIVDPPSMASSEKNKKAAVAKYVEAFTAATKKVKKGGSICYSSCSSHITFEDFFQIIEDTLSKARLTGQILRVSGQGPDHPYPHVFPEFRYLKFVHVQL